MKEAKSWTSLSLTMDSGAGEHVCGTNDAPHTPIQQTASTNIVKYVTANGDEIPNMGEKDIRIFTKEGHKCLMKMQVTKVRKPLASISRICSEGHEVIFQKDGGYIINLVTGSRTRFQRNNNVYELNMWVKAPCPRQGVQGFDARTSNTSPF